MVSLRTADGSKSSAPLWQVQARQVTGPFRGGQLGVRARLLLADFDRDLAACGAVRRTANPVSCRMAGAFRASPAGAEQCLP
jgi:hypothetical protein